ncbi:hypothetical protein HPP92_014965 [Vanilla planifolia]|uniref:Ribose-phosphate pyrophosphokinase N-terminal domain-containing protein n=1 Tax=Vanilla planifolia TaxID=51239 RepID=A0A835UT83_VANPL|nr:hypothetical protein HPP92_014965 [Vanilla planifolia]
MEVCKVVLMPRLMMDCKEVYTNDGMNKDDAEEVTTICPSFKFIHRGNKRDKGRCQMIDPLKFVNGAPPRIPIINDQSSPGFLTAPHNFDVGDQKNTTLRIFSGTANPALAQEIANYLGLGLGKIKIKRFADGEIYVQLQESVRGCDVFLVQPTCPPANENLMELFDND